MLKTLGSVVNPWQVIEQVGADAVRLYLLGQSQVSAEKRFDRRQIPEVAGGFLNTLRHSYKFFADCAGDWTPERGAPPAAERSLADRWVLARLDEVVALVRDAWNGYDVTAGTPAVLDLVSDDLSHWDVRTHPARLLAPGPAAGEGGARTP